MTIENVYTEDLGDIVLQLVQKGLTFKATPMPHTEGIWTIQLLGGLHQ